MDNEWPCTEMCTHPWSSKMVFHWKVGRATLTVTLVTQTHPRITQFVQLQQGLCIYTICPHNWSLYPHKPWCTWQIYTYLRLIVTIAHLAHWCFSTDVLKTDCISVSNQKDIGQTVRYYHIKHSLKLQQCLIQNTFIEVKDRHSEHLLWSVASTELITPLTFTLLWLWTNWYMLHFTW